MNIGIIGAGSIGLLLASHLIPQHAVTLYVRRNKQKDILNEKGLGLFSNGKLKSIKEVKSRHISSLGKVNEECYFVCVKQTQLIQVLPYLQHINATSSIVFLPNGMGHLPLISDLTNPIFVGIVEHGAKRISENEVNHLGAGLIKLAAYTGEEEKLQIIINELHQKHFPIEPKESYKEMLQDKLIINAIINPLTALFQVKNGSIVENNSIRIIAENICREISNVLQIPYQSAWESIQKTALATRENTSSMYVDIVKGKKTEIDAILGYIVEQAKEAIPYTTFMYQAIKALEEKEMNK